MPFNNYNNIVQATPNSCGAFALAAALSDLLPIPLSILDVANPNNRYTVANPASATAFAEYIYSITGNLLLNPLAHPQTATYQYQVPVADMNPPSALVYVASSLGVNAANIFADYNNAAAALFQAFGVTNFPAPNPNLLATEINIIGGPPAYGNPVGPMNYGTLPAANEVHLLLVGNADHWIAINQNQVYDPGTGFVGAYTTTPGVVTAANPLTAINYNNGAPQVQNFCGLWIAMS